MVQFARAREVPFCAAISGLVFLALYMNLAAPLNLIYILAAYGLLYLIEWSVRSNGRASVSGTPRADQNRARPRAGRTRAATDDAGT
jgi:hypothetical protein